MFANRTLAAVALGAALLFGAADAAQSQQSPPPSAGPALVDYRLGTGDKVRLIVFGEPSLSGEFVVSPSGVISAPLIGDIMASNLTVSALQNVVRTKLADGYLVDPRVSAEVLTYRPFYILGEVNKPGEYSFSSGLTIQKAIATAQGFTYRANTKRVFVKHGSDGQEQAYALDSAEATALVSPGDVIRVPERYF